MYVKYFYVVNKRYLCSYFEVILGVYKAALQLSSLIRVGSVRVEEGGHVGELPELDGQEEIIISYLNSDFLRRVFKT